MKYKGYQGTVTYDDEAKIFHGEVVGLKDVITFQGTSVEDLEQAFKDSIDDYKEPNTMQNAERAGHFFLERYILERIGFYVRHNQA